MIFKELTREWFETWCTGLAYQTLISYKNYSIHLIQMFEQLGYGAIDCAALKPYHIQKVINELNTRYSPSTLVKYKAILHNILKCAVRWELTDKNIVDSCVLPRHEPCETAKKYWTADEASRFTHWLLHDSHADEQEILFIILALTTGARRGELVALTEDDIGYGTININKTAYRAGGHQALKTPKSKYGTRIVTVSPNITEQIQNYLAGRPRTRFIITPYVFTQKHSARQMPVDAPSHFFSRLVKQAPVPPVTLHGLRHTHASILIADGMDVAAVSRRLGHSKISVTLDIYTHSSPKADNCAAVKISRLLGIK